MSIIWYFSEQCSKALCSKIGAEAYWQYSDYTINVWQYNTHGVPLIVASFPGLPRLLITTSDLKAG